MSGTGFARGGFLQSPPPSGGASGIASGSVGTPGFPVTGDTDTGLYSPGANTLAVAAGGVQATLFSSQGVGFPAGLVSAPGAFKIGEATTGFYSPGANQLAVAISSTQVAAFLAQGIAFPAGLVGTPGLSRIADPDTGLFSPGSDQLAVAAGGAQVSLFTTQGQGFIAGLVGTPGLFKVGDTDTGLYSPGADQLAMTLGGVQAVLYGPQVVFGRAVRGTPVALVDGANIALDLNGGNNFSVTLGGNRTLDNPTNKNVGHAFQIVVTQDGTGTRTLSFGTDYNFGAEGAPTLSTAAGKIDIISCLVLAANKIACTTLKGF